MRSRGTDTEDKIKQRLETATSEIKHAEIEGFHDKILVNDNLTEAYEQLKKFIFGSDTDSEQDGCNEKNEGPNDGVSTVGEVTDTPMEEGNGVTVEKE